MEVWNKEKAQLASLHSLSITGAYQAKCPILCYASFDKILNQQLKEQVNFCAYSGFKTLKPESNYLFTYYERDSIRLD